MKTHSFPTERDGDVVTALQEEDGGVRLAGGRSDESRHIPPLDLLRHPTLPPAYREF
ncbi:hypothetical protein PHLCEN_2v2320 [Hermanssonia centrifuga]|uniref:Uncharacterized protein n=1 Tax=Hermanssonia centrifuga TaxID=98765 RepID=A0A2R6RPG1_9APHY|nr:hypothetical protein PHLCEN_2v2320 [Hermanssonia centrifuga]